MRDGLHCAHCTPCYGRAPSRRSSTRPCALGTHCFGCDLACDLARDVARDLARDLASAGLPSADPRFCVSAAAAAVGEQGCSSCCVPIPGKHAQTKTVCATMHAQDKRSECWYVLPNVNVHCMASYPGVKTSYLSLPTCKLKLWFGPPSKYPSEVDGDRSLQYLNMAGFAAFRSTAQRPALCSS